MIKIKKEQKKLLIDVFYTIIGCGLYATAFSVFIQSNQISPGGVTGLSAVVHYLFPILPTGMLSLLFNIPLLILAWIFFGKEFITKTFFATFLSAVFIDVFEKTLPIYLGDKILAALAGGVLSGLGLSLIFLRGITTGGTDIAAKLIKLKLKFVPLGRMLLIIDAVVVAIASVAYKDVETSLYSIIEIFTATTVIDKILYGADSGKIVLIITNQADKIEKQIISRVARGVTRIRVYGGYTNTEKTMLLCVLRRQEISLVYSIIKNNDPSAFVVVGEAGEIFGEGFKKKE